MPSETPPTQPVPPRAEPQGGSAPPPSTPLTDPDLATSSPAGFRQRKARRRPWLAGLALLLAAAFGLGTWLVVDENASSRRQAAWLTQRAVEQRFTVAAGISDAIRFPQGGPFDQRLGYSTMPEFVQRLQSQGFAVAAQSRMSPQMLDWADRGLYVPYREKASAGLTLLDCRGEPLFAASHPQRVYPQLDAVPQRIVDALLYIENRELLDEPAQRNPAVEWDRFAKATVDQGLHRIDSSHDAAGGSTLATQIEKYRHSPGGRTTSVADKLRQMASASMRAYLDGEDTLGRRRQIVLDYVNTVPLSAQAGFGEVHGLGDGLWAWYGRDFDEVNRWLAQPEPPAGAASEVAAAAAATTATTATTASTASTEYPVQAALAFKQALSLIVAQRRPSAYLSREGGAALRQLTDSHLRLLAEAGVISAELRDSALPLALLVQPRAAPPVQPAFTERKAATALRGHLQGLLGMPRAYDLDRLDLAVETPLADSVQRSVTALLQSLDHPAGARAAGLVGPSMLGAQSEPGPIAFSFTLYERGDGVNLLRAQTDNRDQPFDINEGARLDLGSTAKLRTLVTYLEQVAALHARWQALDANALAALQVGRRDAIAQWAREHLRTASDRSLPAMLQAALQRSYSADNGEAFFTGGGLHRFVNFEAADDHRRMTVAEAFTRSVNLVFVRLMRDLVQRVAADRPSADPQLLDDVDDPRRLPYLQRFADQEGSVYLARFYRKYSGKSATEAEELLLQGQRPTPVGLAASFYILEPEADVLQLLDFLTRRLPNGQSSVQSSGQRSVQNLHDRYGAGKFSLQDRGYLAGIHPLELWLTGHLRHNPGATLTQALQASGNERQEVYAWLFQPRRKEAQDQRIRTLLEIEAFGQIHAAWQRLGYPFQSMTPSYASALGASGDRPSALAELMGIIVAGGRRLPTARVSALHFAGATPWETRLTLRPAPAEQVLHPAVAEAVRGALTQVVEVGTARRLKGALTLADGTPVVIGGKTGTGDHRFDTYGRGGQLLSSRIVSRSATMVFMLGERHFGTIMAFVREPDAARYRFTSALPSQLLKVLAPRLLPLLEGQACAVGDAGEPPSAGTRPRQGRPGSP